jgi:hypothetical protein
MRLRLAALLCCAAAAAQLTASSAGIKCDMHCAALGCATGGGAACKTCLAAHRKALEGECWASPCPSGKCFYSFEKEYCYGEGPAPPPPAPPAPPGNNSAASFYVAARGGSDSNSGSSFADAFATLQRCLSAVAAGGGGGTCWLGPGRHDMVDAAAVATSSATISGAKSGAEPAILDGSISLSSLAWSRQPQPGGAAAGASRSCIYRSSALPRPVSQLWASTAGPHSYAEGYDVLTPARFPNVSAVTPHSQRSSKRCWARRGGLTDAGWWLHAGQAVGRLGIQSGPQREQLDAVLDQAVHARGPHRGWDTRAEHGQLRN